MRTTHQKPFLNLLRNAIVKVASLKEKGRDLPSKNRSFQLYYLKNPKSLQDVSLLTTKIGRLFMEMQAKRLGV